MKHTYAVHLVVQADDDDQALDLTQRIVERLTADPHEPTPLEWHTTDADDWGEHITPCRVCGLPANRERVGHGTRQHHEHPSGFPPYPIEDVSP